MTITPYSGTVPSRTQTQAVFDAAYAEYLVWQAGLPAEINADTAIMNATSGAGAIAIPYTFSTTTTDADPGNGILRLSAATQNTATVIRADLLGSDGNTYTGSLDIFDDSTSTIKGYIRLVHATDATKFLIFSVTSLASPSGYKNITVTNISSSAASPFANGDAIVLYFTRTGDAIDLVTVGDHAVVVHTGNGYGSTNTKIRRFTTAMINVGTGITYADSATLGATFTINETGIYTGIYHEAHSAAWDYGVSKNSSQLTTAISSIAVADRIAWTYAATAGQTLTLAFTERFIAGDVIRPHGGSTLPANTSDQVKFSIRKIGK